jgi:hypothetical protein
MDRPCGHSWGGTVISEVGTDPKVTSLAYVATGAPEANEDLVALFAKFPNGEARAGIQTNDGYIQLSEDTLPMASTAKRQKSSRQNRDPTADRLSPGEPLRLRCTRSRPGTRWRNSTRRSIPILKAGVEQASPSTPQRKSFHAQHHCKAACRYSLVVFPAAAQQQGPSRIRGTIESVDGNNLTVTARDGTTQRIGLASDVVVTDLVKTTLADVKPGS